MLSSILLSTPADYVPIAMMFVVAIGFVITTIFVTHRLGPKRDTKIKLEVFECGIESKDNARVPFNIKYFLVAILFVLFDVEIIFLYPWAVNFRKLGWFGFFEILVFLTLLMAGFYYVIKKGVLNWETAEDRD